MTSHRPAQPPVPTASGRIATKTARRALALAWVAYCAGFLALAAFEFTGPIWFVLIALTLVVDTLLFLTTHRIADFSPPRLDERQRAVRDHAYRAAYLVVGSTLLLVLGGGVVLFTSGSSAPEWLSHPGSHAATLLGLAMTCIQIVCLLPTILIAWSERDEPPDLE
jgi:hypothetical protein